MENLNSKIENGLSFYLFVNQLKRKWIENQTIAEHIYGAMTLMSAVNSEYDVFENLGDSLRLSLLKEMDSSQLREVLKKLKKGEVYLRELEHVEQNCEMLQLFQFCKYQDIKFAKRFKNKTNPILDYEAFYSFLKKEKFWQDYGLDMEKNIEILKFYHLNTLLKEKIRSGWNKSHWDIQSNKVETIAEHIIGTMGLAIGLESEFGFTKNLGKVLDILKNHEIGEIIIDDITPFDGVSVLEKKNIEHRAMKEVLGRLKMQKKIFDLLLEFDDLCTEDAKFSYYCDKLEADIQSKIYLEMGGHKPLSCQENNVVFRSSKVQKMIADGARNAFDIWYLWDKSIYEKEPILVKTLDYVKSNPLMKL